MRRWAKCAATQIDIGSNFRPIFAATVFQVFRTTFFIALRVQTLKFWLLLPIADDRATGLAGIDGLIDPN